MASLTDRICSRIVRELGPRVTILNFIPFGHEIVSRYQTLAVGLSYSNTTKMDQSHAEQRYPPRNVAFSDFVAKVFPSATAILEIGAGRAVNANLLHTRLSNSPTFTLLDRYVDASRYLDSGVRAECIVKNATEFNSNLVYDLGITRATLSIMPASDAKKALLKMANCCRALILNESATAERINRTRVRGDKTLLHPYRAWLETAGFSVRFHDFSGNDEKFNAIIIAQASAI